MSEREKVSIADLDRALVLAALYNAARPQGMGFLSYDPTPMSRDDAAGLLEQTTYFDYLKGRIIKVSLSGDDFDPWAYDRDNGRGAAASAVQSLRASGAADNDKTRTAHAAGKAESLIDAEAGMGEGISVEHHPNVAVVRVGMADAAEHLRPALDRARTGH